MASSATFHAEEFKGHIVLVTGAARGICGGVAAAFARAGANVVICDILDDVGEPLANTLKSEGFSAVYRHLDVRSETQWQGVVAEVERLYGRLDVLVSGAGILISGGIEETSFEDFKKVMEISCDGSYLAMRCCLPLLKKRTDQDPYAAIVHISSIGAFGGAAGALSYAASRAAILSMTKSAALDFAKRGYRIRVNSVHPGSVRTDLSNITYGKLMEQGMTLDEAVGYMTNLHPLGRLGTVDDIAEAVMYMASDRASWVTGTSLVVDGGRIA